MYICLLVRRAGASYGLDLFVQLDLFLFVRLDVNQCDGKHGGQGAE